MNLSAISKTISATGSAIMRNRKKIAKALFFAGALLEGIPSIVDEAKPQAKRTRKKKTPQSA